MNRGQIRDRVTAGGLGFMDSATVNALIDTGCRDFCAEALWPWRLREVQADLTPTAAAIQHLGPVAAVRSKSGYPIWPRTYEELRDRRYDLTVSGSALFYYFGPGGRLLSYPLASDVLVAHYTREAWQSGEESAHDDDDEPIAPERAHDLIADYARAALLELNQDYEMASAVRSGIARRLAVLMDSDLRVQVDEPEVIEFDAEV